MSHCCEKKNLYSENTENENTHFISSIYLNMSFISKNYIYKYLIVYFLTLLKYKFTFVKQLHETSVMYQKSVHILGIHSIFQFLMFLR
jgi:hypothetical protein